MASDPALRKKVGQLFAVGFHGLVPSPEIKTLIQEYGIGAIVLFKRNIKGAAQLQALILALQQEAKNAGHTHPLFIGIDQENGLVTRITPPIAAQQPGQMALGATAHPDSHAYDVGKATGEMLHFFGINMNYAPSCDINSEPLNPVIGVRSAGDNPQLVGKVASATVRGLRETGVVPTLKHFPGHGDTAVDSHHGLPVILKSRSELERCELVPFRRMVAEGGVEAVMTAHIALPNVVVVDDDVDDDDGGGGGGGGQPTDPEKGLLPATLSIDALDILRKDMEYDGLVITDCLEMDGIRKTYGTVEGSLMSMRAGCDSVMICHTYGIQVNSIRRVVEAVKSGELPESRIDEALRRVTALKQRYASWEHALRSSTHFSLTDLASMNERHEQLAKKIYSESVTVVRNDLDALPISSSGPSNVLLLTPGGEVPVGGAVDESGPKHRTYLDIVKETAGNAPSSVTEIAYPETGLLSDEQWHVIEKEADVVILITRNAKEAEWQRKLAAQVAKRRQDLISIAACNPYDFIDDAELFKTCIAIYEPTVEAFSSAVDVIFGSTPAKGKLPVALPNSVPNPERSYEIKALDQFENDATIDGIAKVWSAALPAYKLGTKDLAKVIYRSHGHHFIALERGSTEINIIGFCLAYTSHNQNKISTQVAVLAVDPAKQGQGIGTQLLSEAREYFYEHYGVQKVSLRSFFPRFWPGLPADLPSETIQFFIHRGFRLKDSGVAGGLNARLSADLYQDIRSFQAPHRYLERAAAASIMFKAIESDEEFAACLTGQRRNFTTYTGWVETYVALNPAKHPSSIMAAFDERDGTQIAWTLMLSPDDDFVPDNWAFPPLPSAQDGTPLKTGVIGCVGVDAAHRDRGIGLAMLCHAIEDMKRRGVEAVFIDSTNKIDWYTKLGFGKWKEYCVAEI